MPSRILPCRAAVCGLLLAGVAGSGNPAAWARPLDIPDPGETTHPAAGSGGSTGRHGTGTSSARETQPPPAPPGDDSEPEPPPAEAHAPAEATTGTPAADVVAPTANSPAPPAATPAPPEPSPALPPDISEISQLSLEALMNQKVETATKTATGLRQIPNRVVVVTADEIRLRGYRYLIELVENLPGIQVMNFVEAETGAHVIVRGIWQNNKILVLYNGHKITSPEGKDFIFGRHDWSLANVKRVEFIFGPASALYGADAVSAVINIVPKDFQDLQGHHVEATLGYGLHNTVEGDVSTGFRSDPLQVRVDGAFHHSAGPNLLKSYPDYYAPLRQEAYRMQGGKLDENGDPVWVAPSLSYHVAVMANLGSSTRLHFLRIYSEEQSAMGFRPPQFEFSEENKWAWYQNNAGLTNEIHLGESLMLRTLLTYNHQECDPKTQFINSFFDDGKSFSHEDYKMFRSVRMGITEELIHSGALFGRHLQIVLGGRFEDIYSLSKISTTTGGPADLRYPINYQTNPAIPNGEVSFHALGGYFQAQYDLLPTLNAVVGMNIDKVWHYKTAFNPRMGATFSPTDTFTLRASAAKAYLVPTPAYQFEGFNNAAFPNVGTIGAIPNTDLKPEDYLTFEAGLATMLLHRQLLLDLSAFHTSNGNYLLRQRVLKDPKNVPYVPAIGNKPGLAINDATAIFTSENGGVVRAYGGEVSMTANVAEIVRPWASYSLVLGSQEEKPTRTGDLGIDTNYLTNQAAHQIKGGVELRPWHRFFAVPSFTWYSRTRIRPDAMEQDTAATGLPPFFILNASVVWEGEHLQLWARAQNLLNAHYYRPGGPVSQQAATRVPQEGVMAQAGIRVVY
jgi:outer membrane receptor protein involved in Fe transport